MASVVSTLYYSNTVDIRPTLRMRISTQLVSHSFCTCMKEYIRSGLVSGARPRWVRASPQLGLVRETCPHLLGFGLGLGTSVM